MLVRVLTCGPTLVRFVGRDPQVVGRESGPASNARLRAGEGHAEAKHHVVTNEDEQINQASALWARPKPEITDEQYDQFYKHIAHDLEPPLARAHAKVEGRQEYTQLFFIPKRAPYDLWDKERRHGIKLYVRRVFIMDDAVDLMPAYLRFVRGVIDSADLPLNVSREILQQSRDVQNIKAASTKRVLGLLDISKPRGNVLLDELEALLAKSYPDLEVRRYAKPTFTKPAPSELRQKIKSECTAVVEALAD